jgi:hypothetical protein
MEGTHKFGGKTKAIIAFIVGIALFQLIFWTVIKPDNIPSKPIATECKTDSLQNVIFNLQSDIRILEEGCDSREHRYEDVISDYEIGLSYLKDYHPIAYKDFHRIVGMREKYSFELERENKKRLNINE